jgi:putative membrane protein
MSRTIGTRLWTLVFFAVFIWSAIHPHDRLTWLLEVAPALIGMMLMAITYQRFPLSPLLYILILLHCVVLMIGGHYTYAEVPFFEGLLGAERNNYDKLGHFFQGFVPAILAREILIRLSVVSTAAWRNVLIVSLCLAFSAFYELIEWWVALLSDEAAESFLGTQGYVWDTQSDMAFALTGAILALLLLSKFHDSQLKRFV